jgi:hypothetical protein
MTNFSLIFSSRKDRNVVDKDILPLLSIRLVNHLLYLNKFQKLIQLTKTKKVNFNKNNFFKSRFKLKKSLKDLF